MKLVYTKDNSNNDILTDENNEHQVMMEWEKPYMEKCIELLEPFGTILEIGFGLGYSAESICLNPNVLNYNVIECSPVVWSKIDEFKQKFRDIRPELQINVIKGRWQDVIDTIDIYDCIFFDDYMSLTISENVNRFNKFLHEILTKHSKIGTKISCYSTNENVIKLDCIDIKIVEFKTDIPSYCKYANGTKMFIPIITKIGDHKDNIKEEIDKQQNILRKKQISEKILANPKMNYLVIDNFYTNPLDTRDYALEQDFSIIGDFPGKRSVSFVNNEIKALIQCYIKPCGGNIIDFPMEKSDTNFNGSYQLSSAYDRTYIKHDNQNNNWIGILYLTPNANSISGTNIFAPINNLAYILDAKKLVDFKNAYACDMTMWKTIDTFGNKFNRLLLLRTNQFHSCINHFGNKEENSICRLIQIFHFTTER